jgi:hypothetical protein
MAQERCTAWTWQTTEIAIICKTFNIFTCYAWSEVDLALDFLWPRRDMWNVHGRREMHTSFGGEIWRKKLLGVGWLRCEYNIKRKMYWRNSVWIGSGLDWSGSGWGQGVTSFERRSEPLRFHIMGGGGISLLTEQPLAFQDGLCHTELQFLWLVIDGPGEVLLLHIRKGLG